MKKKDRLVHGKGDLVVINGGFVILNASSQEDHFHIIHIWEQNKARREVEIKAFVDQVWSSNGDKTNVSDTTFLSSYIYILNNEKMLSKHISRNMVVVYERFTKSFYLIMDDKQTLPTAIDFVRKVDMGNKERLKKLGNYYDLQVPRPHGIGKLQIDGCPTFEVVVNAGLIFIKLEVNKHTKL